MDNGDSRPQAIAQQLQDGALSRPRARANHAANCLWLAGFSIIVTVLLQVDLLHPGQAGLGSVKFIDGVTKDSPVALSLASFSPVIFEVCKLKRLPLLDNLQELLGLLLSLKLEDLIMVLSHDKSSNLLTVFHSFSLDLEPGLELLGLTLSH